MFNMFIMNINLFEIRYVYFLDDFLLMLFYLRGYICLLCVFSYYIQIYVSIIFKYKFVFLFLYRNLMLNKYFFLKMSIFV